LENYNKDVYDKAKKAYGMMIQYNAFFDVYFAQKDIQGDKDEGQNKQKPTVSFHLSIPPYKHKIFPRLGDKLSLYACGRNTFDKVPLREYEQDDNRQGHAHGGRHDGSVVGIVLIGKIFQS